MWLPLQLQEQYPALRLTFFVTTAAAEVATSSLFLWALTVTWKRGGLLLACKNDGSKGRTRREGSSVLEDASGAMKTPEIRGGDEEGVEMRVGDSRNPFFQWMDVKGMHVRDPKSAVVEVLCSYWGDQHQFLNRSPYVAVSVECG